MTIGSFLWGSGGRRLTPEDITRERTLAARMMQTDYSPVQSPWQGLARVSENLVGALRNRRADRASEANMTDQQRIMAALMTGATPPIAAAPASATPAPDAAPPLAAGPEGMGQVSDVVSALTDTPPAPQAEAMPSASPVAPGGPAAANAAPPINPAILEALSSPYVSDEVRQLATLQFRAAQRRPVQPHYWETNNGSLGMVGPDGRPQILYNDPTPRTDYIMVTDPATGQQRFVQVPRAAPAQAPPTDDPSYWTPEEEGGPTSDASGGF